MKQSMGIIGVLLLLGLSGCATLFQGNLSIERAVAQLVPNDPANVDHPNRYIGELEIQRTTLLWIQGKPVPQTGGQYMTDKIMEQLILMWQQQIPVR